MRRSARCCAIVHPFCRLESVHQPFQALGIAIVHYDETPGVTCGRVAGELVLLEDGSRRPACGAHARQHIAAAAGRRVDRYGKRTKGRARRLRWALPGLDLVDDAEQELHREVQDAVARALEHGRQVELSLRPGLPLLDLIRSGPGAARAR